MLTRRERSESRGGYRRYLGCFPTLPAAGKFHGNVSTTTFDIHDIHDSIFATVGLLQYIIYVVVEWYFSGRWQK